MEIKDLQKLKEKLQTDISGEVAKLVEEFKEETGISPDSISIDMICTRDLGWDPENIVGRTKVDITI